MRKIITGFFMSWGMFCAIPCPCRLWDENARSLSVVFLPVFGLIIGALWAVIAYLMRLVSCPVFVFAAVLTVIPHILSGFMHLDGFMDCCDAILSRRSLEERKRILKDSHTGAFAVICLAILTLMTFSLFASVKDSFSIWALVFIPAASRSVSAVSVLCFAPMETSQYASSVHPASCKAAAFIILLITGALPVVLFGIRGIGSLCTLLGGFPAILYARHELGGMSGDISGFGITVAECIGIAVTVLI